MAVTEAPVEILPQAALLIGDQHITDSTGGPYDHVYAANGKVTATLPLAGASEVDAAVAAARAALPSWKGMRADARRRLLLAVATLLREHHEEFGKIAVIDNGAPIAGAALSPNTAADMWEYNAGWADKIGGEVVPTWRAPALDYTLEEPFGVVAIIFPWNGPLVSLGLSLGPALAAGNTIVLKPPELAPWIALRMGQLFLEAGFPPGVVNVIPGGPDGGAALVRHPGVDKIHFTGSGATAAHILAGAQENLTPVGLELGGKSANLIFADADLPRAVAQAVRAVTIMSGQGCINGTRVLVESAVYDEVVALATQSLAAVKMGDPFDPGTVMGPVVNEAAANRIVGIIEKAKESSARLVLGGTRSGGDLADGYFIEPTVFADVDNGDYIAQHEVFGPVLALMKFDTEEQAIALANDTPFGLAAYVSCNDLTKTHRVAAALEAGNIWVNGFAGLMSSAPFGGIKQSGVGRLGGREGIREFTRPKNIWIAL